MRKGGGGEEELGGEGVLLGWWAEVDLNGVALMEVEREVERGCGLGGCGEWVAFLGFGMEMMGWGRRAF